VLPAAVSSAAQLPVYAQHNAHICTRYNNVQEDYLLTITRLNVKQEAQLSQRLQSITKFLAHNAVKRSLSSLATTGAARHGQGGHLPPPPGNMQIGICNPSPEFLTVFVGLSRISGVVPTYLRMKNVHDS